MKYFKPFFYLNLYLIPLTMLINVSIGNSQEATIEDPEAVIELSLSININPRDPNSPSDSFPPSFLCEVFSKWGSSATAESLVTLFRWIRQNDNRSLIEKLGKDIISIALQQDCGDQNTPLHRAIQSGTQLVDALSLVVRSEPSSLEKRNSEGQTPAMILRDRLTSSHHPVTHEDLDILVLLESEQAHLE